MATVTAAGTTWNTTGGNTTVVATPAVGDLIIVFAGTSGIAGGTTALSDNNGDGVTYTQIDSNRTGFSTTGTLNAWVRNGLIQYAVSTTFTATQASSTGGGLIVYRIAGLSKYGTNAARQTAGQSSVALAATPAPAFTRVPGVNNPILGAVCCGTNSTTNFTQRTNYTEDFDNGYNTPATGLEAMHINSGEASATITWGSTAPSTSADIVVEVDADSPTNLRQLPGSAVPEQWARYRPATPVAPYPYGPSKLPRSPRRPDVDIQDPGVE
jgi:hypothetical protein